MAVKWYSDRLLDSVVALADANRQTLGFMPKNAFQEHARKGYILADVDEGNPRGYLFYNVADTKRLAAIAHLCVAPAHRGAGVAKALFDHLREKVKGLYGIRVRCRKDYEANGLWPKLGFERIGERPGRKKTGSVLVEWWFDNGHPSLFDLLKPEPTATDKLRIVIDTNIYIAWELDDPTDNAESLALLEDWVDSIAEIVWLVTPEIQVDLSRHSGPQRATPNYEVLSSDPELFDDTWLKTREVLFGPGQDLKGVSPQSISDSRHLAHVAAARESIFITQDNKLLAKAEEIDKGIHVEVLRPSELLARIDQLGHQDKYKPASLRGTELKVSPLVPEELDEISVRLAARSSQGKRATSAELRALLARPDRLRLLVVRAGDAPRIVYATSRIDSQIHIPFFRIVGSGKNTTAARNVIWHLLQSLSSKPISLIGCHDDALGDDVRAIFEDFGFRPCGDGLLKVLVNAHGNASDLKKLGPRLSDALVSSGMAESDIMAIEREFARALDVVSQSSDPLAVARVEEVYWPMIVTGVKTPTVMIPIQPEWAKELFDHELADQTSLLQTTSSLMLNVENVYYRTGRRHTGLGPGTRILWYVSGSGRYSGVSAQGYFNGPGGNARASQGRVSHGQKTRCV